MKKSGFLLVLVGLFFLVGCSSPYKIVLSNGRVITTSNKPKLNELKNRYVFKDAEGRQMEVYRSLVREISPYSPKEKSPFQNTNPAH